MVSIVPAILTNDPDELREKMALLEGKAKRVQIDIIDGVFADNKTILPDLVGELDTSLLVDFHLMTKEPVDWVERCVRGMADRIFGHIEMMTDQADFMGKVGEVGAKVGLALDLETAIERLDSTIIGNLDGALVMAVPAGFGGQEFDEGALAKIKKLDAIRSRDDTPFKICVDGGINEKNIKEVARAGADEVAIGKHLFGEELTEHIRKLREAAY